MPLVTFTDDDPGLVVPKRIVMEIENVDIIRGLNIYAELSFAADYVRVAPIIVTDYGIGSKVRNEEPYDKNDLIGKVPVWFRTGGTRYYIVVALHYDLFDDVALNCSPKALPYILQGIITGANWTSRIPLTANQVIASVFDGALGIFMGV